MVWCESIAEVMPSNEQATDDVAGRTAHTEAQDKSPNSPLVPSHWSVVHEGGCSLFPFVT